MYESVLFKVSDCIGRSDRVGALNLLRGAINDGSIAPNDGIELMLAVRQGSPQTILEAIKFVRRGATGAYRFVPQTVHAFA